MWSYVCLDTVIMSSTSQNRDTATLVNTIASPTVTMVSSSISGSMIDSRNVYKLSPTKTGIISPQQQQDIVKIRLTKDDSGTGIGYTKTIISTAQTFQGNRPSIISQANSSLIVLDKDMNLTMNKRDTIKTYFVKKPPATVERIDPDKAASKTTPQKLSFNLAQQPTLQLKTAQNKIVLVKMLPKIPQSGPQVIAAPTSRSSVSPTTIALARSVQGLRPLPPMVSPPKSTISAYLAARTPEKKETTGSEIARSESMSSISSNFTLATIPSTTDSFTDINKQLSTTVSNCSFEQYSTTDIPQESKTETSSGGTINVSSTMDVGNNDENDGVGTASAKFSREMNSLKASQSSSKILTEFMQDSMSSEKLRKRRRSRYDGDDSRSCGSSTPTSQKRNSVCGRDDEDMEDGSPSTSSKRSGMRSANAEFSMKQRKFLSSIHQNSDGSDNSDHEQDSTNHKKNYQSHVPVAPKPGWDKFCWRCKTCEPGLETCAGCIRCFHPVCLKLNPAFFIVEKKWNCPECIKLQSTEETCSDIDGKPTKDKLKIDSLTVSLKFAMKRMQQLKGSEILFPLDQELYPNYDQYVVNHVDLVMLQKNVDDQKYRSTDAFQTDVSWILHNASIYPNNNKLLPVAKGLLKVCKQEMNEIEACNECYFNANTCKTWFTEVCTKPHLLVWAKLKGFPFWPAKLMSVNNNQLVDVRFFGDHDRAWVPIKECLLFCEKDPNTKQHRRSNMAECMLEADRYIAKLEKKFGQFQYAEFRTQVEANKLDEHLEAMIPGVMKRIAENGDSQKAKLMLRIIKTADNFLSVSPVSTNPIKTSTPKVARSNSIASSEKIKNDALETPKQQPPEKVEPLDGQSSQTNSESSKSSSLDLATEPNATRSYSTRKRKSVSPSEEVAAKETIPETSREFKKRSNRNISEHRIKDEKSESITPESLPAAAPRCYPNRKRKSVSPAMDTNKDQKHSKVESVVIQRESDSWKTVPATRKRKSKSRSSDDRGEMKEAKVTEISGTQTLGEETIPKPPVKEDEQTNTPAINDDQKNTVSTSVEHVQTMDKPLANKEISIPLVPLSSNEIKTEPTEEEPPPDPLPCVENPPAVQQILPSNQLEPSTENDISKNAPSIAPNELLPIKSEPLSDDDGESLMASDTTATPNMSETYNQVVNPNQVLIRTSNRIVVKDINQLTNQIGPRPNTAVNTNGQPLVLTPIEKPKSLPKSLPKPQTANVPQKCRKVVPNQPNFTHLIRSSAQQSGMAVTLTNSFPGGKNGSSMMHMVHIPSPLPPAGDQQIRSDQPNDAAPSNPVNQNRPQQQANSHDSVAPANVPVRNSMQPVPTTVIGTPINVASAAGTSTTTSPSAGEGQHMMSGFITPSLAAAVTETIVSTPPKMQSRPSGALRSEGDCVYPSGAGPVSQILINNSYKMADFFRSVIEDTLADLSNNSGALEAKVKVLELEIEKLKHCHQQEITKLKHNSDLVLCEMRKNMDLEKARIINEVRKQCEIERIRAVEEAKKKQWCINCGKEALFYCCWNTSYCDYPCQQQHWATHMNNCTQSQFNLPSTAIASKPSNVINSKVTAQHITTPKITTVQTLNLNGRSGLTIQPAQQHQTQQQQHQAQQQQIILPLARGGAQLGKGQPFQRLMINPVGVSQSSPYTIVANTWSQQSPLSTATIKSTGTTVTGREQPNTGPIPTPVGLQTSSSFAASAANVGCQTRLSSAAKHSQADKCFVGSK
ncbi:MYND-type zinc finger-containing chromatin reader Zmynd8-like isoform X3 [Topomyia yanbarensis]|uniref:MYND-type zinc finger-containing chromatin reader Zmynd8-like isoform X3 n=2 Tax=Topomyia yanbarensis TaxID=2498891 RepID=UPI00273AACBB|nr:MYND-type zinc finger-containing chromatin reader Zmynd8-like isoform X3 [Topomyia yanbarensis]XP_058823179.1 MYND-type zinc finger-containing chromatin reader Zmynd8-like isoform X3 [Topomyia yanbarensis]